ncbi:MAG: TSUP family transporter [Clostridia bacterium]
MQTILVILFGILGGLLGGMGMGGGTALIPLLTIFLGFNQQLAQGLNLISFIPMAVVALLIHLKNNMIEKKVLLQIIISGVFFSAVGSILTNLVDGKILKNLFGIFFLVLMFKNLQYYF